VVEESRSREEQKREGQIVIKFSFGYMEDEMEK